MIKKLILCSIGLYINFIILFLVLNSQLWVQKGYKHIDNDGILRMSQNVATHANNAVVLRVSGKNDSDYDRELRTLTVSNRRMQSLKVCKKRSFEGNCPVDCWNRTTKRDNAFVHSESIVDEASSDCSVDKLVDNCEVFREVHGYNSIDITTEEEEFPIAFAIQTHYLPYQTEQILRNVYRRHNVYCIHVDQRADERVMMLFNKISRCLKNVIVIQDRLSLVQASFSLVAAELKCMQAMRSSGVAWKYYINLSEQDFPLKTNLEMVTILNIFDGLNDIETYDHPVYESWRLENKFSVHQNSIAQDSAKSPFTYKMRSSKGSQYGIFSKEFIDFVFEDNVAQEITKWLTDTYSPAETIWATLVTLPWAPGGYPVSVRHMISTYMSRAMIVSGDTPKCHGKFDSATCLFGCGDIWWLQSRPEFFATKFDSRYNQRVLNCLETWYRRKAAYPNVSRINWTAYYKLPHLKYHRQHKYSAASEDQRETIKNEWITEHAESAKLGRLSPQ